mgnify:CR=1 FL=1
MRRGEVRVWLRSMGREVEVGAFLAVEQAALSQVVGDRFRTHAFGWYTLTGSVATGAFGTLIELVQE